MNTNGYPFTPFGVIVTLGIGAVFTLALWPMLEFLGQLTGTGWIGGVAVGAIITVTAFIQVARDYSKHRENLPEHPRRKRY